MSRRSLWGLCLLWFVPQVNAAWTTDDLVSGLSVSTISFLESSVAIDNRSNVHVSYYDPSSQTLQYASLTNGTTNWTLSTITSNSVGPQNSIAVGSDRIPYVAFYDVTDHELKVGALVSGTWRFSTVDVYTGTRTFVSLALGTDNLPRVVYSDSENLVVGYGEYSGVSWSTVTLSTSDLSLPVDLAVNSAGQSVLTYLTDEGGVRNLNYALQLTNRTFSLVSSPYAVAGGTSTGKIGLGLDRNNNGWVSFYEDVAGGIYYAKYDSAGDPSIAPTLLEAGFGSGLSSDLVVSSSNTAHVVYFSTGDGLKLAALTDTTVSTTTLSSGTIHVGVGPAITLNSLGHRLVSYYDGATGIFHFATEASRDLSLSGSFTDFDGLPLPTVNLAVGGQITPKTLSISTGNYTTSHLWEGTYTLTPSKSGYAFLPASRTVAITSSKVSLDFQGGVVGATLLNNLIDPTQGELTTIQFSIFAGHVKIVLYDVRGREVKVLTDTDYDDGTHQVTWDGRNTDGDIVASGIYLVRIDSASISTTQKIAVVR